MNYERIKSELSDGKLKNLYLLYGEEDFLKKAVAGRLETMAAARSEGNLENVRFEKGFTAIDLAQALGTASFFGGGKFVFCLNTEIFKGNAMRNDFGETLGRIPQGCYVVFSEESVDKRNPLFAEMNKAGYAYSIDIRKGADLSKYIDERFKKLGKKISFENINLFMEYSGGSLTDITADIEKIALYMDSRTEVRKEFITDLCSGTRQYKIYEMLDSMFGKDVGNSLMLMKELLEDKVPVQIMLASIHGRLMELAMIREDLDKGRDPTVTRNGRPVADFIIRRMRSQASNYSLSVLREAIVRAAQTDIDIKSGKISDTAGLEILVNMLAGV